MRAALVILGAAALSACVGTTRPVDCRDPELRRFLGQPLAAMVDELRLPEEAFKVDRPSPFGVTLEEFHDRLRVSVDENEVIRGIGCG